MKPLLNHFLSTWPTHPVFFTGDVLSVGMAFGSLYGALPEIAAGMSILWVGIQMVILAVKGVAWLVKRRKR